MPTYLVPMTLQVEAETAFDAHTAGSMFEKIRYTFDSSPGLEWLEVGLHPTLQDGLKTNSLHYAVELA